MASLRVQLVGVMSLLVVKSAYAGCDANITNEGNITSPDFPSQYLPNAYCKWNVAASPGMVLQFTCIVFDLENDFDFLEVTSQAFNKTTKNIYRLTGSSVACSLELGTSATVVFTSDATRESQGFAISFRSVVPPRLSTIPFTDCGGGLKGAGSVMSPRYDGLYPSNSRCTWKLRASDGAVLRVYLSSNFELENAYDFLIIYNSRNASQHSTITDWQSFQQNAYWIQLASEIIVEFTSDDSVERRGFYFDFYSIASSYAPPSGARFTDCGGNLTGEGNITSPAYPSQYPNNTYCKWNLFARPGMVLQLFCLSLDLENNYDYVNVKSHVYNKTTATSYSLNGQSTCSLTLGSTAEILFTSDSTITRHGFAILCHSTEATTFDKTAYTQCGGDLKGAGSVMSPHYAGLYPSNSRCTWKLRASDGAVLRVDLSSNFELEDAYDFLIIYNSRNASQRSTITDWQSFQQNAYWIQLASEIIVEFTSDDSVERKGFYFTFYSIASSYALPNESRFTDCGGNLTGEGNITSPNSPAQYPNNAYCKWNLFARPGMIIQLLCSSFDLENKYDNVSVTSRVYNKTTINSYSLTGQSATCSLNLGSTAELLFTSDSTVALLGFAIVFNSTEVPTFNKTEFTQCGGDLKGSGTVMSPNYDELYPSNCRCTWKITAADGAVLRLWLNPTFELEDSYDFLIILNSRNTSQNSTVKDWQSFQQSAHWIQMASEIIVEFTSDESVERRGFYFNFYSVVSGCGRENAVLFTGCGANLTNEGTITSPNFPAEYPDGAFCRWNLFARPGMILQLSCLSVDLESYYDYVCVTSQAFNKPRTDTYSITGISNACSWNLSATATVVFTSDSSVQLRGFAITFRSIPQSDISECGGTLYDTGQLSSPNFPNNYPNDKACNWTLIASPGRIVSLAFQSFDLESGADYLRIYNETVVTWNTPFMSYTGFDVPPTLWLSKSVTVIFTSDDLITFPGFRATFTSVPKPIEENFTSNASTTGASSVCGGELVADGEISSPNFPNQYPKNAACVWTFFVQRGFSYNFKFLNFSTEKLWDYVVVKRGDVQIAKLFGSQTPHAIAVDINGSLAFFSDESVEMSGFRIRYSLQAFSTVSQTTIKPTTSIQGSCGSPLTNLRTGNARIVGGYVAPERSAPWQVLVTFGTRYFGGVLINNRWVLTAASNIRNASASSYNALLGKQRLNAQDAGQVKIAATSVILYPRYNWTTGDGDIALMKLKTSVSYTTKIRPICIPTAAVLEGDVCFATGWGITKGSGGANLLKVARVPIISRSACLNYVPTLSKNQLCGGNFDGGEGVCQGDTGGSLVYYQNGRYELQGIISARSECGKPFSPSIFTAVAPYTDWIRNFTSFN